MIDRASAMAFLDRPWAQLEEATAEHRAESHRRDPAWTHKTADALRDAVAKANPGWPTAHDRDADFAHHLELRALLDRAADELSRRRRSR